MTPPLEQKIAAALFDGSIRLYDLTTHQKTATFQEHSGRAWTIAPLTPHTLASGADDGLIKIWDCRQKNSVLTLEGHNGRVSKLLSFREHSLLAASCPNDVLTNAEKATFTFWEIR